MSEDNRIYKLKDIFNKQGFIKKDDIAKLYNSPSESALGNRIMNLKEKGAIYSISRTKYSTENKSEFIHNIDSIIKKINKLFVNNFQEINYSIWNTRELDNFMNMFPAVSYYIFECEKDVCQYAFNIFRDNKLNAFLDPDDEFITNYLVNGKNNIVVRPLISRAPVEEYENITFASIEKIMVDIFSSDEIYYLYGQNELRNIFKGIIKNYKVNYSTLISYAKRRRIDNKIREFLINKIENRIENLI